MSPSRCLRVGVVLGDRLVEERLFDGPVTFGQSWKCALSLPVDGVPREHRLFAADDGGFVLRAAAGVDVRLGRAAIEGFVGPREVAIERGARGKLRLGEVTILFQEVARPAPAPRAQLPASVRGTLADRIDRRLATIIGASLLVHIAIAAWAWHEDLDTSVLGVPAPVATYRQDVIDVIVPDPDRSEPAPNRPGIAAPIAPVQTPRPIVPHVAPIAPTAPSRSDAATLANILTGADGTRGPAGMAHRQPGADLDQQLAEVRGRRITIGDNEHVSRVDDRARIGTVPDELPVADPTLAHVDRHETEPTGRIIPGGIKTDDRTSLTPEMVLDRISGVYMAGLQRCYRRGLAADARLSGKLAISFTVDERGHVADPEASGVDPAVSACVSSQMTTWHFLEPRDKDGKPTDASFHVSLALQPS